MSIWLRVGAANHMGFTLSSSVRNGIASWAMRRTLDAHLDQEIFFVDMLSFFSWRSVFRRPRESFEFVVSSCFLGI